MLQKSGGSFSVNKGFFHLAALVSFSSDFHWLSSLIALSKLPFTFQFMEIRSMQQ